MIENLETLVTLAKAGTMMETSTVLKISQSAVSKRIAALERYYDRELIERHGRRVVLTHQGTRLVEKVTPLLWELRGVFLEDNALRKGKIIIGVSEDEADTEMVSAFTQQYGVNYPIVMSTPEIKRAFPGVFALPTSFVVDPDGEIVQTHVGLISPVILEQETRYLSSLSNNATVETVAASTQIRLANAAQATEIPGVDLSALTSDQREAALRRLNADGCPCGCQLTLAQCRINDSSCGISPPIVEKIVAEIAAGN